MGTITICIDDATEQRFRELAYRARMALPPEAVVKVALVDTGRPDAPPVSEVTLSRSGQVPLAFELPYPTARVNAKRNYSVRASIAEGDKVLFATTRPFLVITQGRPMKADLVLDAVKEGGQ